MTKILSYIIGLMMIALVVLPFALSGQVKKNRALAAQNHDYTVIIDGKDKTISELNARITYMKNHPRTITKTVTVTEDYGSDGNLPPDTGAGIDFVTLPGRYDAAMKEKSVLQDKLSVANVKIAGLELEKKIIETQKGMIKNILGVSYGTRGVGVEYTRKAWLGLMYGGEIHSGNSFPGDMQFNLQRGF